MATKKITPIEPVVEAVVPKRGRGRPKTDTPWQPTATSLPSVTNRTTTYLDMAIDLCREQTFISLNALALAIGCSYYTIRKYWQADATFQDAFKSSRQRAVDKVKERAFERAVSDDKPSDLMSIYLMNNFDEEIVDRLSKNRDATITIKLDVPQAPIAIDSWANEVDTVKQLRAAEGA